MTSLRPHPAPKNGSDRLRQASQTVTETVAVLMTIVTPSSVVDMGSEDPTWVSSVSAGGVDDVLLVRPPLDPALSADDFPTLAHDLRLPLRLTRRFDLAIAVGVAERLPSSSAELFVRTLCNAAEVVAFAAVMPGLAPPGTANARWAAWWDSLFEPHGYVPHDVARPLLWEREEVDLKVRQGLVLYAPNGRFTAVSLPCEVQRSVVHPETYVSALATLEARRHSQLAIFTEQILGLEVQLARLAEENRQLTEQLQAERVFREEESPTPAEHADLQILAAQLRRDNALLRAGMASAERQLAATPTPSQLLDAVRQRPRKLALRAVTSALPLRYAFRRIIGPPAPLWDEAWYVAGHPDVLSTHLSPLWHYRRHGARLLRSPHPWFDPDWYATRNPAVMAKGHDPLEHYLRKGWHEGYDPHPLFATTWYRGEHAARESWRRSPLEHYLERGRSDRLSPHPLFDVRWYLDVNADVRAAGADAVEHFSRAGWREGRDPHPLFDVCWYLENNPDVARAGVNPLIHYIWFGWLEGRDPHPLFEVSWYLDANPDVREAGLEPLAHYITVGAAKGLATGRFDTRWYMEHHPECQNAKNPLVFFLETGRARGDAPRPPDSD